jgi:8-oxo-dGTP diphosphatase
MQLTDLDWPAWRARDLCTLVFAVERGQILLMRKKRGLGAGKVNGPGGRVEPTESLLAGAIREFREEVGAIPRGIIWAGRNCFQFTDGYSTDVHVFRASSVDGAVRETDEAAPFRCTLDAIPWTEMWTDDALWLPHLLASRRFHGRWILDGDRLLDWALMLL